MLAAKPRPLAKSTAPVGSGTGADGESPAVSAANTNPISAAMTDLGSSIFGEVDTRSKSGGVHTLASRAEATRAHSTRTASTVANDAGAGAGESPDVTMITPPPPPMGGGGLLLPGSGGGPPERTATAQSLPIKGTARIISMTTRGVLTKTF
jgi:hypothetical protein